MSAAFAVDWFHVRTLHCGARPWRGWGDAKRHAKEHGQAVVFRADDSAVVFARRPDGTLSRRTFKDVQWRF